MCLGSFARLVEAWEVDGTRAGRLEDGGVVSLLFVPDAEVGATLFLHLGVPVEVVEPEAAAEALALRGAA